MYSVGTSTDTVYQYSLGTAWDVSTSSYDGGSKDVNPQDTQPTGVFFSPDGSTMFVSGFTGKDVNMYTLGTNWNVSTASFVSTHSVGNSPECLTFSPDGSKMYVGTEFDSRVYEYDLPTNWSLTGMTYSGKFASVGGEETPRGLGFSPDGKRMFTTGFIGDSAYQYTLSTAWDVSTASYDSVSVGLSPSTAPRDLFFSADSTKMYITDSTAATVYQYDL